MNIYDFIKAPLVTEKSYANQELGKYTFIVQKQINKIELAKAIEKIYGVRVIKVNICKLPQKDRVIRRGRVIKKRPNTIKLIVTLKKGQSLDVTKIRDLK